ncbi:MAG: coiled-coil domain-containing protein [Solirubrobacterales bacterium]
MPTRTQRPRTTRRGRIAVLSLIVFVALVVAGVTVGQTAFGDPASKMAQKQDELSRIQSSSGSLQSQIDAMNQRVDQLIGEESHLRQAQAAAQAQLDQKQAELDKATAQLNAERAELRRIRAKLQKSVGALEQLLVQMYKSNDPDITAVIMQSANWSDLLTRTEYIDHIQSYDNEVVARVRGLRDRITALVNQLQATHDRIQAARDAVAAKEREIASQHAQIQQQQSSLVSARNARQGVLNALLAKEHQIQLDISHIPAPAGRATIDSSGDAIPPSNAPLAVRAAIEAANQIDDLPYIWGGGHGSFTSSGYDCSGAVSFALHGGGLLSSPLDSTGFEVWGDPGAGNWITVFANSGHAWAMIAGLRWDTAGNGSDGPRWSTELNENTADFVARHPSGY